MAVGCLRIGICDCAHAGIMLWRNTEWTRSMLALWWRMRCGWADQAALWQLLFATWANETAGVLHDFCMVARQQRVPWA